MIKHFVWQYPAILTITLYTLTHIERPKSYIVIVTIPGRRAKAKHMQNLCNKEILENLIQSSSQGQPPLERLGLLK